MPPGHRFWHFPVIRSGACPSEHWLCGCDGCCGGCCGGEGSGQGLLGSCPGAGNPGTVGRQTPAAGGEPLGQSAAQVPSTASLTCPLEQPALGGGVGFTVPAASVTRIL